MSKLSIIIVNYNVKYFLEQALSSVKNALHQIPAEIIVVDNASSDGSCEMVKTKFPEVQLIENKSNVGFSKANNQGMKIATGEFTLLLNPDTLLQEDTLEKAINFMEMHDEAGALGVKMLDGKGNFLPESKRSFPTPAVSFFKLFGLSALFPKSKLFAKYHLGYLNEDEIHDVDVLAGAFMLIRKKVLDEIGLLDESFFMYGEDIDLSYRIQKAGYKNYYFPKTRIIHYKGESTKKGSLNYVKMFYTAMIIFARKHFSPKQARFYSFIIHVAVYFKAGLAFVQRLLGKISLPLIDATLLYAGLHIIKNFWATNIKNAPEYYPPEFMLYIIPGYIVVWLVSVYFSGGYDKPLKTFRVVRGLVAGTLLIAAFYAFLPETLRFSRAIILLGAGWAVLSMVSFRILLKILLGKKLDIADRVKNRMIIVGSEEEAKRTLSLLTQSGSDHRLIGFVSANGSTHSDEYLGTLDELPDIRDIYQVDEIIFCGKDISAGQIIASMVANGPELDYKIIPEKSISVIGSNSKNKAGDLYAVDINLSITTPMNRRNKRMFDLGVCFFLVLASPVLLLQIKTVMPFIRNWCLVFIGAKSWVGYEKGGKLENNYTLPQIREGVLSPLHALKNQAVNDATRARLNLLYAKDYTVYNDLQIVWMGWRDLGN